MKKTLNRLIKNRYIRGIIFIWIISFLLIEGLIVINGISEENKKADYVVVLGAGLRGESLSLTLLDRMNKCLEYLNKNPDTKVIVTGGQGPGEDITESEAMKRFLVKKGIEESRIIKEEKSTSTLENIKFTKKILKDIDGKEKHEIIIITNGFHLFRAKLLAKRNDFIPYGIPSETRIYLLPKYYIREYFAVIKSFVFDR